MTVELGRYGVWDRAARWVGRGEDAAELEEERRLLFVGITRARRELFLSHCRVREFRGQRTATIPSVFLGELPAEAIAEEDRSGFGAARPAGRPPTRRRRAAPAAPGPGFWPARQALPGCVTRTPRSPAR